MNEHTNTRVARTHHPHGLGSRPKASIDLGDGNRGVVEGGKPFAQSPVDSRCR
jgi:hypothetical protein